MIDLIESALYFLWITSIVVGPALLSGAVVAVLFECDRRWREAAKRDGAER